MLVPVNLSPCLALSFALASALSLDLTSQSSITDASKTIAANVWSYYTGYRPGDNPGNLPAPYYWWEAGAMFDRMIDYWYYTGDTQYNWAVRQAVTWQAGSSGIFMPQNQTSDEGNDDQVFWGFTAMTAAEHNFEPPLANESVPSYVGMAQAVAKSINDRWDPLTCGGGLRWQLTPFSGSGYNYKNSVANGGIFMLASRLARYTGNDSYVDLAETYWNWWSQTKLYDSTTGQINDGLEVKDNCSSANPSQYTYNYTIFMLGLANLYNYTNNPKWLTPLQLITKRFFAVFAPTNQVLSEVTCAPSKQCDNDQLSFKASDMQWLVQIMQLVPAMKDTISPYYHASAAGAAAACPSPQNFCGFDWSPPSFNGTKNIGNDMSALAAIQGSMFFVKDLPLPLTLKTGGTSVPNANVGAVKDPDYNPDGILRRDITTGDRAGAGIVTVLVLGFMIGGAGWLAMSKG